MAIRKELFFEIRVPEFWLNTISDDYALASAVHAVGLTIAYAPGALTPCVEHIAGGRFLAWTRPQMTITTVYNSRIWRPGRIAHVFYCVGTPPPLLPPVRANRLPSHPL